MDPVTAEQFFAEDLMRYIMHSNDFEWESVESADSCTFTTFDFDIGKAIQHLINIKKRSREVLFKYLSRTGRTSSEDFESIAKDMGNSYFIDGFNIKIFLCFCSLVISVALHFYENGVREAPGHAVAVISDVLKKNKEDFSREGGWYSLLLLSRKTLAGN